MTRHFEHTSPLHRFFWESGRDGRLRFLRCEACRYYLQPPAPVCSRCLATDVAPHPVSGRGHLYSYTVNYKRWSEDVTGPYVIAVVELSDQAGLRLTTNLIECDLSDVCIGLPLEVRFEVAEAHGQQLYVPVFAPARITT